MLKEIKLESDYLTDLDNRVLSFDIVFNCPKQEVSAWTSFLEKIKGKSKNFELGFFFQKLDGSKGCIQNINPKISNNNSKEFPYYLNSGNDLDNHKFEIIDWQCYKRILIFIKPTSPVGLKHFNIDLSIVTEESIIKLDIDAFDISDYLLCMEVENVDNRLFISDLGVKYQTLQSIDRDNGIGFTW